MSSTKIIVSILSCLFVSSCVSLTELARQNCQSTDWSTQGEKDAMNGQNLNSAQTQQCQQVHAFDEKSYTASYARGLKRFCTHEYGRYFASQGSVYASTCPASSERDFLDGYSAGRAEYEQLQMQKQAVSSMQTVLNHGHAVRSCNFDPDCDQRDICDFPANKCRLSGKSCMFESDCTVKGVCDAQICRMPHH